MKGLLFTYLLTYGGAVVAVFNPFAGLLVYVTFAVLRPEFLWYWSVPSGRYSYIVAIALLAGWVFKGTGSWTLRRAGAVTACFVGYWLWGIVGATMAPDQAVAWAFVDSQTKIVLPFLVGVTVIRSVEQLRQLTWVLVLSQGYVAFEYNLSYFQGFNRLVAQGYGGMDEVSASLSLVIGAAMALMLALSPEKPMMRAIAGFAAILMAHCVFFSFSRGGMLGLLITPFAVFVLLPKKNPKQFVAFALLLAIGLRLAGTEVRQEFESAFADKSHRDASAQSRVDLWSDSFDAMLKRPIFGIGPDHFPLVAAEYGWPAGKEAHSTWLQLGAELGFPGVLLLLAFYGVCLKRLWPIARGKIEVSDPWLRSAACAVIAAFPGFFVAAQFVTAEGLELPYYVNLIGAGVLRLCSEAVVTATETAPRQPIEAVARWAASSRHDLASAGLTRPSLRRL
jgi:O-antigen ligase